MTGKRIIAGIFIITKTSTRLHVCIKELRMKNPYAGGSTLCVMGAVTDYLLLCPSCSFLYQTLKEKARYDHFYFVKEEIYVPS